jgi:hypothetical protein
MRYCLSGGILPTLGVESWNCLAGIGVEMKVKGLFLENNGPNQGKTALRQKQSQKKDH